MQKRDVGSGSVRVPVDGFGGKVGPFLFELFVFEFEESAVVPSPGDPGEERDDQGGRKDEVDEQIPEEAVSVHERFGR